MKSYYEAHEWKVSEDQFNPHMQESSESIFSLGNGKMGQRANMEETYSGHSLPGNYVAGVYYPDKTRVGWWKNGYPEYFAKVLNSPDWMNLHLELNGESIDFSGIKVLSFYRALNMQHSTLVREARVEVGGCRLRIRSTRFLSIVQDENAALQYEITVEEGNGTLDFYSGINGMVRNKDANYDEYFWDEVQQENGTGYLALQVKTRKLDFHVAYAVKDIFRYNGQESSPEPAFVSSEKKIGRKYRFSLKTGDTLVLEKSAAVLSSLNHPIHQLISLSAASLEKFAAAGFDQNLQAHSQAWEEKWRYGDIKIDGDVTAQQGIRFNILQLNHTYTGTDPRLNIGPKGFTGEKYGGSTYWDTEAYCLPFYLSTAPVKVARQLLEYRFKQLDKAIENAAKLGFHSGAALYPMVTMNGEECHNEWEITFEEIHRNGAIAYAIYNYISYTGDASYLLEGGLQVLIGISRFWAQRVNWSEEKQQYVMLGVTGPNEYENNINNNWYTNCMAAWCLEYTAEAIVRAKTMNLPHAVDILTAVAFREEELVQWEKIRKNMFFPRQEKLGIWLQQEGYMDKEQRMAADLPVDQRPINQHWSWDRILRSCFIKQADVLQGIYFFEDRFSSDEIQRNFDFYEPRTVHESSLSPCIHVVLAARLGYEEKAYDLYLRTSRLDLDDYNREVAEGLHITSMAGTWLAVVQGFGGMKVKNGELHFNPFLPGKWKGFSYKIRFRDRLIEVQTDKTGIQVELLEGEELPVYVHGVKKAVNPHTRALWSWEPAKASS